MYHSHKSLLILCVLIFSFLLASAQVKLEKTQIKIPENSEELQTLGLDFISKLVQGQLDGAGALISDEFLYFNSEKPLKKDAFLALWKSYHADASELGIKEGGIMSLEIVDGSEQGQYVLIYGLQSWTPNSTKKPVSSWGHLMIKIQEEKISQVYEFQDNLSIMMQMGFSLNPPANPSGGR